jgi:glyoxylase-like metal-dependent hydrolase (beta-lactamase superfamily II)
MLQTPVLLAAIARTATRGSFLAVAVCAAFWFGDHLGAQSTTFRVVLLGTGTPAPSIERLGPSVLVEAGAEKLIFDVGRGVYVRLSQLGLAVPDITRVLFTHLHSDHVSGLPDLWLTGRFAGKPRTRRVIEQSIEQRRNCRRVPEKLPPVIHRAARAAPASIPWPL